MRSNKYQWNCPGAGHALSADPERGWENVGQPKGLVESGTLGASPFQAQDTAVPKRLFKHGQHVNFIHDHMQLVPAVGRWWERGSQNMLPSVEYQYVRNTEDLRLAQGTTKPACPRNTPLWSIFLQTGSCTHKVEDSLGSSMAGWRQMDPDSYLFPLLTGPL